MSEPLRTRNPWLVLSALCLGQAVVTLDATIVNVAASAIGRDLDTSLARVLWAINAYMLVLVALLVTAGRLGDRYGKRTLFLTGIAVFTVASAACGFAQDPAQLIGARALQGVGGALLYPQTLAMLTHIFPADRRATALGVWGAVAGLAVAAGPSVGGLLVGTLGWRWIFFVNLPIGAAGFVFTALVAPNPRSSGRRRLDVLGTVTLAVALLLVTYGLIEGETRRWGAVWGPVTVPILIGAGIGMLGVFLLVERRRQDREPLIPFAILRNRNFSLMAFVVATLSGSVIGMVFLTPLYLHDVAGMSPSGVGLVIAAGPLVSIAFAILSGMLTDRFDGRYVLLAGLAFMAGGLAWIAVATVPGATWRDLLPGVIVFGVGMGVVFSPPGTLAMREIAPSMSGAASGVFGTVQRFGGMLGSVATGALLQNQLADGSLAEAVRISYVIPVAGLVLAMLAALAAKAPPSRRKARQVIGERTWQGNSMSRCRTP